MACPVFSGYQTVSTQGKQLGSQLWTLPLISQHSILFYSTQWTFLANSVIDPIKKYIEYDNLYTGICILQDFNQTYPLPNEYFKTREFLLHVLRKNRITHKVNPLATSSVSWMSRKHLDVHLKKSSPAPNISVTSCTEPSSDHLYQARYKALPIRYRKYTAVNTDTASVICLYFQG